MKIYIKILITLVFVFFIACEEYTHEPISPKGSKPLKVENVSVTPINGGLEFTYDVPNNNDLLYVKAVYKKSDGTESEVRSSIYKNTLTIEGFGDTEEKIVDLYAVNRAEISSDPVEIKAAPLTPPVFLVANTLEITADWGGAHYTWNNDVKKPIRVDLLADTIGDGTLIVKKTIYTEQLIGDYAIRGFESKPTLFAAVVRDQFGNKSDTIYPATPDKKLTPLYEEVIDKTKFLNLALDNDTSFGAWGGDFYNLFDDDFNTFGHTQGDTPRPDYLSIDLGQTVKLSRFRVYMRSPSSSYFFYTHGNPKKYRIYASYDKPSQDGSMDGWIKLRDCESIKPSGLPQGQNSNEDIEHGINGDEYTIDNQMEVRYIRILIDATWDGAGYTDFSEISFWGEIVDD